MKVSELQGELLDMWVAKAEGNMIATHTHCGGKHYTLYFHSGDTPAVPKYSMDWEDGGPIFEREGFGIAKFHEPTDGPIPEGHEWCALWRDDSMRADGPTPLIAGMRLFVMSKFGEEVSEDQA